MKTPTNVFVLDVATIERIEKWAARSDEGGWQGLCAKILDGRLYSDGAAPVAAGALKSDGEFVAGLDAAIENLQALRAAHGDS